MHLFFFTEQRKPGFAFRFLITATQLFLANVNFTMYLISPRFCHRFVGYLEEQAVHTYTEFIKQIDRGQLPEFAAMKAPQAAIEYYDLAPDATFRDMILAIRADEVCHRETNHHFADLKQDDEVDSQHVEFKVEADLPLPKAEEQLKKIYLSQ